MFKSNVTTNQSSPISLGSKSKRIFDLACLGKKRFLNGFFVVLRNAFLKYIFFKLVKESLKSIATTNQSSPISMGSMSKIILDLGCLGKKLDFQTVFSLFCKMYIWNIFFFKLVKELFKSNVTTNQSSPISLGSKSKRIFDQACLRKKLDFKWFFRCFAKCIFEIYFFFLLVKELFKSIVTTNQSSPISLGFKSERIFDLACLGKS